MTVSQDTIDLLIHLAGRPGHDEVKADFRELLVREFGVALADVDFERRVPEVRGRLDALIGRTVFEAKSDLGREWRDVAERMPSYLADRERETRERYVGLASDGSKWVAVEGAGEELRILAETVLDPARPERFLAWLDGVVALKASLSPDAITIRFELGRESIAYRRAHADLVALWERLKTRPDIYLKRQLWAELLKLVYGKNLENDALWLQHTFLVVVAKCVAVAVLGLREDDPARLLSGEAFAAVGINGAVESDFFDWIVADAEGVTLMRRIMAHIRRFRLGEVQSDVLKILYESLIDRDERHGLGEYYTPDWLAAKIVRNCVDRPLEQRVLDPACGSGTFLFHAIRRFLAEAEDAGLDAPRRAQEVCAHVAGMDIHPVAVIIARVTYMLALQPALTSRAGSVSIPVYLGDAMQLSISQMMAGKELSIRVPPPLAGDGRSGEKDENGREQLDFPDTFCRDPALFDKAIEQMRAGSEASMTRQQIERALYRTTEQHYRADVTKEQQDAILDLGKTYLTFDKLRREGRDTVWAYVARNLSRPLALSAAGGWAQIVVGNPPWVAYRHMNTDLQKRFRELAKAEKVYVGGKLATQNDLAALFTARAASLYLRSGGGIGFVLPMAVLTRGQFARLRSGSFTSGHIQWDEVWAMSDNLQPLFPVPSCVVFGRRRGTSRPLPDRVRKYSGTLPMRDAPEEIADAQLLVQDSFNSLEVPTFEGGSPYRKIFRDGATLYPRKLIFIERQQTGRLGSDPSSPFVKSRSNSQEKHPWKQLPGIESRVESQFLKSVLLGESILPYRVFKPFEGVVPINGDGLVLDAQGAANQGYSHLHGWMRKVEAVWEAYRPSQMTFIEQLNYYGKLEAQFPITSLRVVYAKSGTLPAACIIRDERAIVDHMLYWAAPTTELEGHFLCAVINSEAARKLIESMQSRGQWGARHFDKVIFNLPIPRFDLENEIHASLAVAAQKAENIAAAVELPDDIKFQRARSFIRDALRQTGIASKIDKLVEALLEKNSDV